MYEYQENIVKKLNFSDSKLLEEFILYLVQIMKKRKISQASFAAEIGVDAKTISRWVTGKNKCSVVNFLNIISIVGIDNFLNYLSEKFMEQ